LIVTEADHLLFQAIERHGPLPTPYIYEFTKHLRKDYVHLQHRLTEFYNGDACGPYLTRPPQQYAGYAARYQHLVYDLAPRARRELTERGGIAPHPTKRTDPFLHRLMCACVGASFELSATTQGLRYIPRHEILTHQRCPAATRTAPNPLAISLPGTGDRTLIPDDLFGLHYPGVGFSFFAVEIDRNTESIERTSLEQSAFGKKVIGYLRLLQHRAYRDWWGIPNLTVLTVTTNATHATNLVGFVRKHVPSEYTERFRFAWEPSFSSNWRVPERVLSSLLDGPWLTTGAMKYFRAPPQK
jgi:hypothetical protein